MRWQWVSVRSAQWLQGAQGGAAPLSGARSLTSSMPTWRAQCAQQKYCPRASSPWPMIGTLQWKQRGASTWIAHWNESKTCAVPPMLSSNVLS